MCWMEDDSPGQIKNWRNGLKTSRFVVWMSMLTTNLESEIWDLQRFAM